MKKILALIVTLAVLTPAASAQTTLTPTLTPSVSAVSTTSSQTHNYATMSADEAFRIVSNYFDTKNAAAFTDFMVNFAFENGLKSEKTLTFYETIAQKYTQNDLLALSPNLRADFDEKATALLDAKIESLIPYVQTLSVSEIRAKLFAIYSKYDNDEDSLTGHEIALFEAIREVLSEEEFEELSSQVYDALGITRTWDYNLAASYTNEVIEALYNWALDYNLTTVDSVEDFRGNSTITRDEAMTILFRTFEEELFTRPMLTHISNTQFRDWNKISSEFRTPITYLKNAGIVKGDANGNFRPKSQLTIYEALLLLSRADSGKQGLTDAEYIQYANDQFIFTIESSTLQQNITRAAFFDMVRDFYEN